MSVCGPTKFVVWMWWLIRLDMVVCLGGRNVLIRKLFENKRPNGLSAGVARHREASSPSFVDTSAFSTHISACRPRPNIAERPSQDAARGDQRLTVPVIACH